MPDIARGGNRGRQEAHGRILEAGGGRQRHDEWFGQREDRTRAKKLYERELERLQVELVKLQEWMRVRGLKVVILFEGRDAAGKGGDIRRITLSLSPRVARIVARPAPTEREKTQWYFQRYVPHLPARWSSSTAAGTTAPASIA